MKAFWHALLAIVAIAALLQVHGLATESVWVDEATTLLYAQRGFMENLRWVLSDTNLPAYDILLWGWIRPFGTSEIGIRSLSVLLGTLSVLSIGLLGRKLFSPEKGLAAAALLALSPAHIEYAQTARPYALLVLLSILSSLFFLDVLRGKRRIPYVLSTALLVATHPFGALVLFGQTAWLVRERKRWRRWAIAMGAAWVSLLVWVPLLIIQSARSNIAWISSPVPLDLLWTFGELGGWWVAMGCGFLALALGWRCMPVSGRGLAILYIGSILVVFVGAQLFPVYYTRYFLAVLFAWILAVAAAALSIRPRAIGMGLLACMLIFSAVTVWHTKAELTNPDWRSAAAFLEENAGPHDTVLLQPAYQVEPFRYYSDPLCFADDPYYCPSGMRLYPVTTAADLDSIDGVLHGTVWLVSSDPELYDPDSSVGRALSSRDATENVFAGITVRRYEAPARIRTGE